jgi:LuxR family transcriptional regulator, maltose regulon positive regulatory protein
MEASGSGALPPLRTPFALLESKLAPPRLREGTISRPELAARVRPKPPANVSLVVAPAGYGKTTLLAELFDRIDRQPVAWLSLDERDNDPVTLLTYLALALHRIGVCDRQLVEVLARPRRSLSTMVARLQRSIQASSPFTLLVDDLHLVTHDASLRIVSDLVRDLPPVARVVAASRTEPQLPLDELRKAARVAEFGIEQIRLSESEVGVLLRSAGLTVSDEDVAELAERTEGWPAGVYLAALAALARKDGEPVTAFRGSDHFVSDYVRFEHLDYLPPEDVEFLLRASVLDRLAGPLCDAALRRSRSATKLEELAQTNLFLIPVAEARPRTYRFQNLFREALNAELRRVEPGLAETIAARASAWCEKRGDVESAIEYAYEAGDHDRFAGLVQRFVMRLYYGGRFVTIARWFALLDDDALLERHPALAATGALVQGLEGRDDTAVRWADIAERAPADTPMPDGSPARAWTALVAAALCRSGVEQMRTDAELAVSALAPGSWWRPSALLYLGVARLLAGDTAVADETLADAHAAATAASIVDIAAFALAERSLIAGASDRWSDADDLAVQARDELQDAHLDGYVTSATTYAASAHTAVRREDWVRARDDLERAEQLLPPSSHAFPWFTAQVLLETARVRLELGDASGAAAGLSKARQALGAAPGLGILETQADALAAELDSRSPAGPTREHLTPAELRLLPLLTTHLTFREIAAHLNVSRNTVKTQAICTYRKLGASSRSEAIQRATELGLVERSDVLDSGRRR